MISRRIHAETGLSLLFALMLFSFLFLNYSTWQAIQHQRFMRNYQTQQAWRIAENHLALLQAGEPYKGVIIQNNVQFEIDSQPSSIRVRFPLGEITLEKP
ncbi:MAG: DUF5374 domain-containing protein [Pasteurellaceae bacterium]|nr:DUF5374 domain-containing protein [Pasteurellaceae bacterium]